ncbi:adenosylcobalamin-dependent ribonucleoside-diphosphate reductase [Candidatus Woesearchaeota archaeon]|nr:adenosylcobalamin-dependent ribonucleoside-diphosphate reductase [Candidatus Woesearchaeota archaeon]
MPSRIYKRDGRLVSFRAGKISDAMNSAFQAVGTDIDSRTLAALTKKVTAECNRRFCRKVPKVEEVQDIVEFILIRSGYERTAHAYINYRREHQLMRDSKRLIGVHDELKLGVNAVNVLKRRYLLKDDDGNVIETPAQMFRRVARAIASVESRYGNDPKKVEEEFYTHMSSLDFLPNSPTLMNAGTRLGQLSACFVLPVEDSMEGIFTSLKHMALIHQSGGGTGFSFSRLRPRGSIVSSTKCTASGPVSFMSVFDRATDVIKQGGRRRGANMGVLRIDHPDILEFITAKKDPAAFQNFNISVAVTDKFMYALAGKKEYTLVDPHTGKKSKMDAKGIFRLITTMAWNNGDPGLIFIDRINRFNPTPQLGEIESTNPCGEQPLLPYESCNLGSINLSRFVRQTQKRIKKGRTSRSRLLYRKDVDWDRLEQTVRLAVRFLDDVIDANIFPVESVEEASKATRKIGLGVMGFADMLIRLGVPYDSEQAEALAKKVMKFIYTNARKESEGLATERGSFPKFRHSRVKKGYRRMRNASVTTIAPTGTISIIAGCSSGIEPLFGISYVRNVMSGSQLLECNSDFESAAKAEGIYSRDLMIDIARHGTLRHVKNMPPKLRKLFVTAMDIRPEWHIRIQAAFQKYTDSAVSKTVNFPQTASVSDVESAFLLAWNSGCKGITVYRYGSREGQVLTFGTPGRDYVGATSEYSGGCPKKECPF